MFRPNYKLTNAIVNNITDITAAREAILHAPILPMVENKLYHEALISRTHHSTSIEGNPLNLLQVKALVEGASTSVRPKDKQEILGYAKALKYLETISTKKHLSEAVVLKIQKLITQGTLPPGQCGKYRDKMVYVVNHFGQTVFTPPETKLVHGLAMALAKWLNSPASQGLHPALVTGIAHYELVRIHPFIDGNGRTARALATLILYQRNFDIKHFFALDDYYNGNRAAYYAALQYVDPEKQDITQWLEYFTEGVAVQMDNLKKKVDSLAHDPILGKLKKRIILKDRQWKLLEFIKENSRATNLDYQKVAGISREMSKRDFAFLVKEGLLKQIGQGRSVYYTF